MSSKPLGDRAFGQNVLWNMASLAFLAAAGLLLNFAIGRFYGPAALGLFNVVFTQTLLATHPQIILTK